MACDRVWPVTVLSPASLYADSWLARIAIQPVLQDQTNTHTHIATASARSPLQVAQTAVQAHVPYARRRPRHRAIAHYASNLCKQFTHYHIGFVLLSRNIYTHAAMRAPAPQPAGDGAAARVGQGHDSNDGRWYTTGRTAPVPEYVFSLTPYHSPTHD